MDDDLTFDFEAHVDRKHQITAGPAAGGGHQDQRAVVVVPPQEVIGQQPGNYKKNYKKTVCTYWLRGMCMKGDACGFLHQFDVDRMPICRNLLKHGECKELDCPYKHDTEEIKECNMYRLGFCIYGPQCRFKHKPLPGPPPAVEVVEAAKPKDFRDINRVVNSVNPGVIEDANNKRGIGNVGWSRGSDQDGPDAKHQRLSRWEGDFRAGASQTPPTGASSKTASGVPGPAPPPGPKPPPGPPPPLSSQQQHQTQLQQSQQSHTQQQQIRPPGVPPPQPPPGPPPSTQQQQQSRHGSDSSKPDAQQTGTQSQGQKEGGSSQQQSQGLHPQNAAMPPVMAPNMQMPSLMQMPPIGMAGGSMQMPGGFMGMPPMGMMGNPMQMMGQPNMMMGPNNMMMPNTGMMMPQNMGPATGLY